MTSSQFTIPHDWYRRNDLAGYEGYWVSLVYCLFAALGVETRAEEATCRARWIWFIEYQGRMWLLEFKIAELGDGQRVLDPIRARGYPLPLRWPVGDPDRDGFKPRTAQTGQASPGSGGDRAVVPKGE
jgi:hypothetical protein